jgi:small subunit ribosomal protein S19
MAKKEFTYRGKTIADLKKMSVNDFLELLPSRQRRSMKRGMNDIQKKVLQKIKANKKTIRTHARDMVILPEMIGFTVNVYDGKQFVPVILRDEMLGHVLGEFVQTRKKVEHSAPGIGATKSSANLSVK